MKQRLLTLVAVAVLACGAGPTEKEQELLEGIQNRPKKTELATPRVQARLDLRAEQPVVVVMINGKGPFRLMLGTGTGVTVLDDAVVKKVGLQVKGKTRPTDSAIASRGNVDVVGVESLALGDAVFRGFDAITVDLDRVLSGQRHYDGILALPIFAGCLLTIDYSRSYLLMQKGELPAADGMSVLDYKETNGAAAISLVFGDVPVDVVIDFAEPEACVLASKVRRQIELSFEPWAPESRSGVITDMDPCKAIAKGSVRLGQRKLVALPVDFHRDGSVIGQGVLQNFVVTLDQKNRRVRFARDGEDRIRMSSRPAYGIELKRRGSFMKVVNVHPGSAVAESVIDTGDKILTFEGRAISTLSDDEITAVLRTSDAVVFTVDRSGFPLMVLVRAYGG